MSTDESYLLIDGFDEEADAAMLDAFGRGFARGVAETRSRSRRVG